MNIQQIHHFFQLPSVFTLSQLEEAKYSKEQAMEDSNLSRMDKDYYLLMIQQKFSILRNHYFASEYDFLQDLNEF
jgi:hypothetical protein